MDAKAQIRAILKIEDIIGRTVELKRHGNYLTGFCFSFVMRRDGLTFEEVLESLAREANVNSRPTRPLTADRQPRQADWQGSLLSLCDRFVTNLFTTVGENARCWLNQRGLTDTTLQRFRVGFNQISQRYGPHYVYGGITIPHYHRAARTLWGVKIRLSQEGQSTWMQHWQHNNPGKPLPKKLPKYVSVKGTQQSLFNVDDLPATTVLICEGEFDVMLVWQEIRDIVTPVSLGSATSRLSYQWIRYTLSTRRFLLALDADDAGRQSRRIWQGIVSERGLDVPLPSGQDLTDYYQNGHNLRGLCLPLLQSDRLSSDYPLVIRWPAEAEIATIGGQWRRLPTGQIEATYANVDELRLCLDITRCIRGEEVTPGEYAQVEI